MLNYSCSQITQLLLINLQLYSGSILSKLVSTAFKKCKTNKNNITIELKWLGEKYCTPHKPKQPRGLNANMSIRLQWIWFDSFRHIASSFESYFKYNAWKHNFKETAVCSDVLFKRKEGEENEMRAKEAMSGGLEAFIQIKGGNSRWKWSPEWWQWAGYWFVLAGIIETNSGNSLEVTITAECMSAGPLGSTTAPGSNSNMYDAVLRGNRENNAVQETTTNTSLTAHIKSPTR